MREYLLPICLLSGCGTLGASYEAATASAPDWFQNMADAPHPDLCETGQENGSDPPTPPAPQTPSALSAPSPSDAALPST